MPMGMRSARHAAEVLGGRKVRSFFHNLTGHNHHVTVDRHAASIALLGPSADKDGRRTATLSDRDLKVLDRPGAYVLIAACYRSVARSLDIPPSALQAITWCYWRQTSAYSTMTDPNTGQPYRLTNDDGTAAF